MTATYQQPPVAQTESSGLHPADHVRLAEQVRVAVLFRGRQTDVTLPASPGPVTSGLMTAFRAYEAAQGWED